MVTSLFLIENDALPVTLPKAYCLRYVIAILYAYFRAKEKADVDNMPSVRGFFKDQSQYDERMSKEQVCLSGRWSIGDTIN